MGNINAPSVDYFESFASEIESKFQRIKNLVTHRASSGDYHEEIIRTILRTFLTKRYSVKKGFIYAGEGNVSNQLDILIIDENSPAAYLFQEEDFAIVIPSSVVAFMEVKTTLNAPDFDTAIQNIESAKKLLEFPHTIPGIVFGYDGTKPSDDILDNWFKRPIPATFKDKEKNLLAPNAFMFFTDGQLLVRYTKEGKWELGGEYYHRILRDDSVKRDKSVSDTGWQISLILAMIISACEFREMKKTHFFQDGVAGKLIQSEGSGISHSRFAFGEGLSKFQIPPAQK